MKKEVKKRLIILSSFMVLLLIAVYIITDINNKKILFSASESELGLLGDKILFSTIIRNNGLDPIEIEGCGFANLDCEEGCSGINTVAPGERFIVEVQCNLGVTQEEIDKSHLYIEYKLEGDKESKITSSGSPNFPSFSKIRNTDGSSQNSGDRRKSGGGPRIGDGNSGGSLNRGSNNSGGNSSLGSGQSGSGLSAPYFIEISGSQSRTGFIIVDTTPSISFLAPEPTSRVTLPSISCRWSPNDVSFNLMPSSNTCSVDLGLGICTLSEQSQGQHSYSVACSDGFAENSQTSNLDLYGIIDSINPSIIESTISPISGTGFDRSIRDFILRFNTSEETECRIASGISPTNSFFSMRILCPSGSEIVHECKVVLEENSTTLVNIACIDQAYNQVTKEGLSYLRNLGVPINLIPSSSSGGSSSASPSPAPSSPSTPPESGGSSNPPPEPLNSGEEAQHVGEVVREFDSERTIFNEIIDWFKKIFD